MARACLSDERRNFKNGMNVTASMDPIIALTDVRLTLSSDAGPVNILRGVDLKVRAGEKVSVVGPSGAGKTSLMMIVAGLEQPTQGAVSVAGVTLGGLDEDALALFRRDNVGIVFQDFHLIPTMTATDNVAVPLELAGRRDALQAARERLESVGLGHRLTHYPGQLSGGEQQRVAIARAVISRPRLLLADEPTGNVDDAIAVRLLYLFEELNRMGTSVVIATHNEALVSRFQHRQLHLQSGKIEYRDPGADG